MSGKIYVLKKDFKSFNKGKEFVQISKYGDDHLYAAKLQEKNVGFKPKKIEVTDKQLYENFETLCKIISA